MNAYLQLITSSTDDARITLDTNDVRRLLCFTSEDRLAAVWRLVALGMLTIDEVLVLEWTHLHLHSARVITRPADVGCPARGVNRVVELDHGTLAALSRLRRWRADARLALGPQWQVSNRVVVHEDGRPMTRFELESRFDDVTRGGLPEGTRLADFSRLA